MADFNLTLIVEPPLGVAQHWVTLIEGMCNGELGAYFEERIAIFGPAAETAAEAMLDEWDECHAAPVFSGFQMEENILQFDMEDGSSIREHVAMLKQLFEICGALSVSMKGTLLEDTEQG